MVESSAAPVIAVAGATGLVGRTMLRVLDQRGIVAQQVRALASTASVGRELPFRGTSLRVEALDASAFAGVDYVLFSAGSEVSRQFAPIAVRAGAVVIDNSSAWRMDPTVPLVVPEVNPQAIERHQGIIANPNCSTIQLVVALKPLHDVFGIRRVVVSTYQAVSGAGQAGVEQLLGELQGKTPESPKFRRPVAFNTIFHDFHGAEATEEEVKMERETRKIMGIDDLPISVTCVRIPTTAGHGESVNVEFESAVTARAAREVLRVAEGIVVVDDPFRDRYPTVLDASGRDEVFVGRIREDRSRSNTLNLWIVADNVRKGAATNAVQILQRLAPVVR